ncbi:hypothetical protein COCOR_00035 [Corallococcus coralloides DSM 2259]|uniref:Uncharacterized protein n=1 Tax=Corallococcus coralloides (strain ATCC 25202 / DSM 2259 / NBRC 100086 / M2) TaxID=1144275 RepID=H8MTC9_CORCM|nr:hypothetical protein [Corallococcus coralloides]AFE03226.1 hypothetical protein COCOR_00035 [Corallococcus coralloides DSM 2259]
MGVLLGWGGAEAKGLHVEYDLQTPLFLDRTYLFVSPNRFRLEGALSHPFGETPAQRETLSVEAAANPRWAAGFGVFARQKVGSPPGFQ